jgi:hypothetical protein
MSLNNYEGGRCMYEYSITKKELKPRTKRIAEF